MFIPMRGALVNLSLKEIIPNSRDVGVWAIGLEWNLVQHHLSVPLYFTKVSCFRCINASSMKDSILFLLSVVKWCLTITFGGFLQLWGPTLQVLLFNIMLQDTQYVHYYFVLDVWQNEVKFFLHGSFMFMIAILF